MFNRRRYNRKPGRRRSFRPKVRRKGAILRPLEPQHSAPPKPEFDASGAAPYSWLHFPQSGPKQDKCSKLKVLSLREICARALAVNADALEPSYMSMCSWACWKHVWTMICYLNLDSPAIFRMFAKHFGLAPDFKCHHVLKNNKCARSLALLCSIIPTRSHRIDNVFFNISHKDFVSFLSGIDSHVVLDCSLLKDLTGEDVIKFCNLANLTALDLSHNDWVNDQFLYTLGRAMMFKNMNKFKILRMTNCPNVTEEGFYRFLKELLASLAFIVTDIRPLNRSLFVDQMERKLEIPVPGAPWKILQEQSVHHDRLVKYNLSTAAHYLLRNTDIIEISSSTLIWDIKMFPSVVEARQLGEFYELLRDSWKKREKLALLRPAHDPILYLRSDKDEPINVKIEHMVSLPSSNQSSITQRVPRRRPKFMIKDTKTFLGLK